METPNYYAVIPANIRYSKEISMFQKLLYAEITALTQKDWYCWASNKYFAELYSMGETYISKQISDLAKKGFLQVFIEKENGNKRRIYIGPLKKWSGKVAQISELNSIVENDNTPIAQNNKTYCTKVQDPYCTKVQENNININNKKNKKKNEEINREKNKEILEKEKENFHQWSIRFSFYQFLLQNLENIETNLTEEKIADINKKLNEFRSRLGEDKARLEIENFIEYHRENETNFKSIISRLNTWLSHLL